MTIKPKHQAAGGRQTAMEMPLRGADPARGNQKLFLSLREASEMTGLSQAYLRQQVDAGNLPAVHDVGIRIRRGTLDVWEPGALPATARGKVGRAGAVA